MSLKIRRALLSVSDKTQLVDLAKALASAGAELVATGNTAKIIAEAGLTVIPVEKITGSPEAFQGRMKTLSYQICSGILFRRGDPQDEADAKRLGILPIDCVVVNFYPFESQPENEMIDIGGPTLVRAAAKNASHVLVATDPAQYSEVISELKSTGSVSEPLLERCRARTWERVFEYDRAIAEKYGESKKVNLRYGENPHQSAELIMDPESPVDWESSPVPLSYNNILDLSAAYELTREMKNEFQDHTTVVIVKHGNPCGVSSVARSIPGAQQKALENAWAGDPVSAFGGVLCFSHPLETESAKWLSDRFIECVAAPEFAPQSFEKKKNLKTVFIRSFEFPKIPIFEMTVVGGRLRQQADVGLGKMAPEKMDQVTQAEFPKKYYSLARFGIAVNRALKSNAIALVREVLEGKGFQLVGAGPGQPNRVDSLQVLAIPRAKKVIGSENLSECVLVSDAFFPFRDSIDVASQSQIRMIVQPGGSKRDSEVIAACDEKGIAMVLTGVRHFKH